MDNSRDPKGSFLDHLVKFLYKYRLKLIMLIFLYSITPHFTGTVLLHMFSILVVDD